jgi:hypothetical protein
MLLTNSLLLLENNNCLKSNVCWDVTVLKGLPTFRGWRLNGSQQQELHIHPRDKHKQLDTPSGKQLYTPWARYSYSKWCI